MTFTATVLYVDDLHASLRFYQDAFGFQLRFYDPEYEFAELTLDGAVLALGTHTLGLRMMPGGYERPANGRVAGVEIAFFSTDVQAAFDRALAAGATPVAEPKMMPWGMTVAYARATDGTIIGISTPPPALPPNVSPTVNILA